METRQSDTNTTSSRSLRIVLRAADRLGYDQSWLYSELGVDPTILEDSEARIPYDAAIATWQRVPELTGDVHIGIHLGQQVRLDDFDIIGYVLRNCHTMRDVVDAYEKYRRLLGDNSLFELVEDNAELVVQHRIVKGIPFPDVQIDYLLSAIACAGKQAFGDHWQLRQVRFARDAPNDIAEYERVFAAPVHFGTGQNALVIHSDLDQPFARTDAQLRQILEEHADSLLEKLPADRDVDQRIRDFAGRSLADGPPTAETLSSQLGMSARSLRRHLASRGTSVSQIVDQVRKERAIALLNSSEQTVSEIAYAVGFSEPSAFSRAFKRWTGATPTQHRRRARTR